MKKITKEKLEEKGFFNKLSENRKEKLIGEINRKLEWLEFYYSSNIPNIKSKYMTDLYLALICGEKNSIVELIDAKCKFDVEKRKIIEQGFVDDPYYFNMSNVIPTQKEIDEANAKNEKFLIENEVLPDIQEEEDKYKSVDALIDVLSQFYDNNDPYPFMVFNDTFDFELISDDFELNTKYNKTINSTIFTTLKEAYKNWKPYLDNIGNKNKYFLADKLDCANNLLLIYERTSYINLYRTSFYDIFIPILMEMYKEFDIFDFLMKYDKAIKVYNPINENFKELFINQYTREFRIKNEIKLF